MKTAGFSVLTLPPSLPGIVDEFHPSLLQAVVTLSRNFGGISTNGPIARCKAPTHAQAWCCLVVLWHNKIKTNCCQRTLYATLTDQPCDAAQMRDQLGWPPGCFLSRKDVYITFLSEVIHGPPRNKRIDHRRCEGISSIQPALPHIHDCVNTGIGNESSYCSFAHSVNPIPQDVAAKSEQVSLDLLHLVCQKVTHRNS